MIVFYSKRLLCNGVLAVVGDIHDDSFHRLTHRRVLELPEEEEDDRDYQTDDYDEEQDLVYLLAGLQLGYVPGQVRGLL